MYSLAYETGEQGGNCLPKIPFLCCMLIHLSPMQACTCIWILDLYPQIFCCGYTFHCVILENIHTFPTEEIECSPPYLFWILLFWIGDLDQKQMPPFWTAEISSVG
jgi:hypothetical protein